MRFTKAHGTGNDFVVLADLEDRLELPAGLVRALCDRHRGIGADGVLRLGTPPSGADVFMDYRNADGSVVQMCGNGVRVTAKYLVDHGLVAPDAEVVQVATRSGIKAVHVERGPDGLLERAEVDMGPAVHEPSLVPFETDAGTAPDALLHDVEVEDGTARLGVASMGNPHGVLEVEDVTTAPVRTWGPALERHARFPEKANIGFAEVVAHDAIRLRVWERGVGETQACGTGACAAVAVLHRRGRVGEAVEVTLPGGVVTVRFGTHGTLHLGGPAVEVAHGELDGSWLVAAQQREGATP
jgi:diaminopimelate epimerase